MIDGAKKTIEITKAFVRPESFGAVLYKPAIFNNTINVVDIGGLNVNAVSYTDTIEKLFLKGFRMHNIFVL